MVIIGLLIANGLKNIVYSTCKSIGIPSSNLISTFVFWFVFITALVSALSQAKIDTDFVKNNLSIILGGAVAAFAIGYGFASKDMIEKLKKVEVGNYNNWRDKSDHMPLIVDFE